MRMATQNRRSSFSASTMSSLAKRQADNGGKLHPPQAQSHLAKKRAPLSNITNHKNAVDTSSRAPSAAKIAKTRKGTSNSSSNTAPLANVLAASSNVKPSAVFPSHKLSVPKVQDSVSSFTTIASARCSSIVVSPSKSDGLSVSMDETMSTCESFKSPEVEYMDNNEVPPIDSIDRKTFSNLYISEDPEKNASICNRDMVVDMDTDEKIANVDSDLTDPQMCATIACDIYKHLRASEVKKRPSTDFMERIQKDINASMRAILIDWLVEVAEEYRLVPDTLYLTVNYIDRYLSGNVMNRQRLQLLGVSCMMVAAKYEEICAPQVEEFCYITDNTYFKEEVLQMESDVLNYLKFELTAPTTKCFLRRFVRAAQGVAEAPSLQLECMANYLAELSLLEYGMLSYAPSLIAASAIFLAKYILIPSRRPWDSTLQHYTLYQPSDLCNCVKDLHHLCYDSHSSTLPAIRDKYNQHKYKYVAKKHCPPSIPREFFQNQGL